MHLPTRPILLVMLCAVCGAPEAVARHEPPPGATGHDWPMFGGDATHASASDAPTGITAANVASLRLQRVPIDGTVDASPIYLHGVQVHGVPRDVFLVTTTYGRTLAIDADSGAVLWRFTPSTYASVAGTAQITNATPAADADRTHVYAASPDGRVQKLAVADGRVVWSTAVTKLPGVEKITAPLTYFRGRVIVVTGGYVGDAPPYQGHVAVLDAGTGAVLHVWNSLCSDRAGLLDPFSCAQTRSAIWGRAGAVIDTTTGNILVATGNGPWDGRTSWGDAVLELDPDATRLLANYTPSDTRELDASDADIGSTSPALLDATHVLQGGKDGQLRLVDLAQAAGSAPHLGGEVQSVATPGGGAMFTAIAVARAGGATRAYVATGAGTAAWTYQGGRLVPAWSNGNAGTSPVLAGQLLFVYDPGGSLRVYDPASGHELARLPCGGGHWNSPVVADGRIALPEGSANGHDTSGILDIWRTPSAATP